MTYLERKKYRKLRSRVEELRAELERGDAERPLTRGEALEMLDLMNETLERMGPDRWDHLMEVVAEEAARRAGQLASMRSS